MMPVIRINKLQVVDNVLNVFDTLTVTVPDEDIQASKNESGAPKK